MLPSVHQQTPERRTGCKFGIWNEFFFKPLSYLYEVVRTNFATDFWTFRNS